MPSRADARTALETALRVVLVGALALALWRSLQPREPVTVMRRTDVRGLNAALREATRSASVARVALRADSMPEATARAWLRALRRAGVAATWSGGPPAIAAQVERTAEPESRARVLVAGEPGAISLADSAGMLDSVHLADRGAMLESPNLLGRVRASRGRFGAEAGVPASTAPRAVLVLGRAGWESRFVGAALREAGWTVRSRQPAAPGVVVADADLLPIDTARYAVAIALDTTAADLAPVLARFVAAGGGLVLAGAAPALPALAALAPAHTGAREPGRLLLDADTVTRAGLPRRALVAVRRDALPLDGSALAVRRAGLGRVLTVGYEDTWRWRMLGGASGLVAHRGWWSRTVALVAPSTGPVSEGSAAAPRAALVEDLGPPVDVSVAADAPASRDPMPRALLALVVVLLLAETASRRFRGAP